MDYKVATLGAGEYFGGKALLSCGCNKTRYVSIYCAEDCHLGVLSKANYEECIA